MVEKTPVQMVMSGGWFMDVCDIVLTTLLRYTWDNSTESDHSGISEPDLISWG